MAICCNGGELTARCRICPWPITLEPSETVQIQRQAAALKKRQAVHDETTPEGLFYADERRRWARVHIPPRKG